MFYCREWFVTSWLRNSPWLTTSVSLSEKSLNRQQKRERQSSPVSLQSLLPVTKKKWSLCVNCEEKRAKYITQAEIKRKKEKLPTQRFLCVDWRCRWRNSDARHDSARPRAAITTERAQQKLARSLFSSFLTSWATPTWNGDKLPSGDRVMENVIS